MKKTYIILLSALFISFYSFAQIPKGKIITGGLLNINGNSTLGKPTGLNGVPASNESYFGIGLSGIVGKFVKDNLAIGIGGSYSYNNNSYDNTMYETSSNINSLGLSLFLRKYKMVNEKWYVYYQGTIVSGISKSVSDNKPKDSINYSYPYNLNNRTVNNSFNVGLNFSPGVTYFLSPRIALDVQYSLLHLGLTHSDGYGVKRNSLNYGINVNLSTINLGVMFYL